MDSQYNNKKFY